MTASRLGGQSRLRVLLVGGGELNDVVASSQHGGSKLSEGLAAKVSEAYDGKYTIELESKPGVPASELMDHLRGLRSDPHDVVILSLLSDVLAQGRLDVDAFRPVIREVCNFLKETGAYVLIANVSTFDREDMMTNYSKSPDDTPNLRAHKVAATILDLSHELGISVIDADRLLAEIGALDHVDSLGRYSAEASGLVRDEILRILADYGFFEERPLLAQAGARRE